MKKRVLCAALIVSLFCVCQAFGQAKKVVEIDFMYMSQAWDPVNFGADPVTAAFIEKTGVKLKCSAPSGDWEQIANVMLVSNDYPSLMLLPGGATFNKYVAAGALVSIDDLAKKYNYPRILDGSTIPLNAQKVHRSVDGKLYGVPNWFSTDGFGSVGQGISVRNDIFKSMGEPKLATMDDYYKFLVSIRDKRLEYKGVRVWPLGFYQLDKNMIGNLANIYGANIMAWKSYNTKTKRVESMLRRPELVKALTFLNKCYREGVVDPESFTFNSTQQNEAYSQGRYATVMSWFWNMWTADSALSQADPNVFYHMIDVPQGTPGVKQYFGYIHTAGDLGFVVTKNCKLPAEAARFIDFFLSDEGQILDFYGVEGNTLEYKNSEPYLKEGVYEAKLADWYGYAKTHGVRAFDVMMNQKWNWERKTEAPKRQADRALAAKYAFDATFLKVLQVSSTTTEGVLNAEIEANVIPELTKIIIEKDSSKIPSMVKTLLTTYERKGLVKLEDEWSRQYSRLAK